LTAENLKYIYDNLEKRALKSLNNVSEELKQKRSQQKKIHAELQNLLKIKKSSNLSKAASEAIADAENHNQKRHNEIQ